ncbi:MAG: thiopurine S-methyltransferase [Paracoccaceae bacterium]|nr:thiopurine S-methyltransferase [Paracoccaceae bacterium]
MEESFWQERWRESRIGFHEGDANTLLARHFDSLNLAAGSTVLVPLCGKSFDLEWIAAAGHKVIGVEFNQGAVEEVFQRNGLTPEIVRINGLTRYSAGALTLYVGDFFELTADLLPPIHAIYDRAALVALPDPIRARYARHLVGLTGAVGQLLISVDYPQEQMKGPPFSVPGDAIRALYEDDYDIDCVESRAITGQLATRCSGQEEAWRLSPRP